MRAISPRMASILAAVHEVQDVGRALHATDVGRFQVLVAGELALHDLVEFIEGVRRNAVEGGDAQQHVHAGTVRQQFQRVGAWSVSGAPSRWR